MSAEEGGDTGRLDIQATVKDGCWSDEEALEAMAAAVLERAAAHLAREAHQPFPAHPVELSMVFTDDDAIRTINLKWRGQDKPTNVLSFPAYPLRPGDRPGPMLGDIVIARQTVEREARALEKPFADHLTHLMVHGFLHLFGYDHEDAQEAEQMEGLEIRILGQLGLSDPYAGEQPV